MKTLNLCCIGFGNVGQALAKLLVSKEDDLREQYGITWKLTGVATRRLGWIAQPKGLPIPKLLAAKGLESFPRSEGNVRAWLKAAQADVLFEISSLEPLTGQPAIDHVRAALRHGAHAITANKGIVVHGYRELRELAAAHDKRFLFESTVMDGAPIFSLFRDSLPAIEVRGFRGILNSTTNVVLSEMEAGKSLEEGIQRAQAMGLAETDPSHDVDGWDGTMKVAALVTVLMDTPLHIDQIQREGIRGLTGEAVREARANGHPYKLVCRAERQQGRVVASVRPEQLPESDPLARVSASSSIVEFSTDMLPGLTITEVDPTPTTTAYGLLADFINAVRSGQ